MREVKKALILAAGMGTRLAPLTNDRPKSLVPVNGKPILMKQIENLHENGIRDITVVSGYRADVLKSAVLERFPEIRLVESADYASTNNMYSAYLGIRKMFPEGAMQPFFMMNGDVFYDSSVLRELAACPSANAIVVDVGRYIEESMKVIDRDGRIVAISKQIEAKDALGCSIDVYKFSEDGAEAFYGQCRYYIEEKRERKLWSEAALNDALEKAVFRACPLEGRWLEIDNCEDLAAAEKLFSE